MKCLVVLLSILGLTFAAPAAFDFESKEKYLPSISAAPKEQHKINEISALLQALMSINLSKEDQDANLGDLDDGTVADLQGLVNVLEQVEVADLNTQLQGDKNVAMAHVWGRLENALKKAGHDAMIECRVNIKGHCANVEKIKKWQEKFEHWFDRQE